MAWDSVNPLHGIETAPGSNKYSSLSAIQHTPASGNPQAPFWRTEGDTFPANPVPYHYHFLTDGVTGLTKEWFYFDPTLGATGRWVSVRTIEHVYILDTDGGNAPMEIPGLGATSSTFGYKESGELLLVNVRASQATPGTPSAAMDLRLSIDGTAIHDINLGTQEEREYAGKNISFDVGVGAGYFHAERIGTGGAKTIMRCVFRRYANPT